MQSRQTRCSHPFSSTFHLSRTDSWLAAAPCLVIAIKIRPAETLDRLKWNIFRITSRITSIATVSTEDAGTACYFVWKDRSRSWAWIEVQSNQCSRYNSYLWLKIWLAFLSLFLSIKIVSAILSYLLILYYISYMTFKINCIFLYNEPMNWNRFESDEIRIVGLS